MEACYDGVVRGGGGTSVESIRSAARSKWMEWGGRDRTDRKGGNWRAGT